MNSEHTSVHLVADHLGTIGAASYAAATASGAPDRKVDTRRGVGGTLVGPSGRLCFAVAGSPGDAAIVNLTPVEAQGTGDGQLISSDVAAPPVASNVNYGIGTVDPNVAVARIGADGEVCYVNSEHTSVHLVADHLGTIGAASYAAATASGAPDRKVDTRRGVGGTLVGPSGRLCFAVAGSPGDAAIVNLTPVEAQGTGDGQLISSDVAAPPVASNVNYGIGTVDPNVAVARIGADGEVCYVNSEHTSVHLVADHLGTIGAASYAAATASGAPDRKVDTRPPPPVPAGFEGTWTGLAQQLGRGPYNVTMRLSVSPAGSISGDIDFGERNCGGPLHTIVATGTTATLYVDIDYGTFQCIDSEMQIELLPGGQQLDWSWYGEGLYATATLDRS